MFFKIYININSNIKIKGVNCDEIAVSISKKYRKRIHRTQFFLME